MKPRPKLRQYVSVVLVQDLNADDQGSSPHLYWMDIYCPRWSCQRQITLTNNNNNNNNNFIVQIHHAL